MAKHRLLPRPELTLSSILFGALQPPRVYTHLRPFALPKSVFSRRGGRNRPTLPYCVTSSTPALARRSVVRTTGSCPTSSRHQRRAHASLGQGGLPRSNETCRARPASRCPCGRSR